MRRKVTSIRAVKMSHPNAAQVEDCQLGELALEHGAGHFRFDVDGSHKNIYVPETDLIRFLEAYQSIGEMCLREGRTTTLYAEDVE